MAAGRLPFRGENLPAVLYSLFNDEPETLARLRPETAPGFERIVARLLARDPEERYQSAGELAGALAALPRPEDGSPPGHAAPAGTAESAAPAAVNAPPPLPHGPRAVKPRRWLAAGGAAAAAALLAATGFLLLRSSGGPGAGPPGGAGG